jgi:hypothetical protein
MGLLDWVAQPPNRATSYTKLLRSAAGAEKSEKLMHRIITIV